MCERCNPSQQPSDGDGRVKPSHDVVACGTSTTRATGITRSLGWLYLHPVTVVGRRAAWCRPIIGEHVGTTLRIDTCMVGNEPRAFLDRHDAGRDAVRHLGRELRCSTFVEHSHALAVGNATR